jgi:hypothetical protein
LHPSTEPQWELIANTTVERVEESTKPPIPTPSTFLHDITRGIKQQNLPTQQRLRLEFIFIFSALPIPVHSNSLPLECHGRKKWAPCGYDPIELEYGFEGCSSFYRPFRFNLSVHPSDRYMALTETAMGHVPAHRTDRPQLWDALLAGGAAESVPHPPPQVIIFLRCRLYLHLDKSRLCLPSESRT